ncbi:MAG: HPt (histidine-containing phosphotransfer) domain-containing protein [Halioglobus sp.]|jgi:HPt (histidine-containing phosphotransfer) domain-containing protein
MAMKNNGAGPDADVLVVEGNSVNQEQIELDKDALDQLRQLEESGQPSFLNQVIDAYLEVSPAILAALLEGVRGSDASAIEHSAHTLKSSSATLGAISFSKLCLRLEIIGRSEVLDEASDLIRAVQSEFSRVCEALARERLPE